MNKTRNKFDEIFLTTEYFANPYQCFNNWHEGNSHLFWSGKINAWVVTSYEAVANGLTNPEFNSSQRIATASSHLSANEKEKYFDAIDVLEKWIVFQDPPSHTRLRKLVNKSFTPRTIAAITPKIENLVDALLLQINGKRRFNFVDEISFLLPATVICELLGIPEERQVDIRNWSEAIAGFSASAFPSAHDIENANKAVQDADKYLTELFGELKNNPNESLLSKLVNSPLEEDHLNNRELVALTVQLFFAGFETTEGLLGNLLLALHRNPGELEKLRNNPDSIPNAVEEGLRFDSSILKQSRVASKDLEFFGQEISKGDYLHFMIASANWDPSKFEHPESFLVDRKNIDHLSFGHGIHFCIGAPLARLESAILIRKFLEKFPVFKVEDKDIKYPELLAIRKPRELWINT